MTFQRDFSTDLSFRIGIIEENCWFSSRNVHTWFCRNSGNFQIIAGDQWIFRKHPGKKKRSHFAESGRKIRGSQTEFCDHFFLRQHRHHRQAARRGSAHQGGGVRAQVSVRLADEEADHLPRDVAVVRWFLSRDCLSIARKLYLTTKNASFRHSS